jgi:hypothetical protein
MFVHKTTDETRRTGTALGATTKLVLLQGEPEDVMRVGREAGAANETLSILKEIS